jgi:hypothetical protein
MSETGRSQILKTKTSGSFTRPHPKGHSPTGNADNTVIHSNWQLKTGSLSVPLLSGDHLQE